MGGGIPLPNQEDFALWGLKVSDLVHTLGEFAKNYLSPYFMWRKYTFTLNPENMWRGRVEPPPTPGNFFIFRV